MLIGLAAQSVSPLLASRVAPFADKVLKFMTCFLLILVFSTSFYARGFLNSIGAYAIVTQLLFYAISSAASYWLSPGLKAGQKSVLSLGMSTRNLGDAFAPFLGIAHVDQQAMVMVAIAIPIQLLWRFAAPAARRALAVVRMTAIRSKDRTDIDDSLQEFFAYAGFQQVSSPTGLKYGKSRTPSSNAS